MPTTPSSTPSSSASGHCPPTDRCGSVAIEWRPSLWVVGALWCFGPFGALSLLASDLGGVVAWPLAVLACTLAWRAAGREAGRAPVTVVFPPDAPPTLDGRPLDRARLQWRGPLAFLQWREGRRQHALSWWPDTLPPSVRRELRLAVGGGVTAPGGASMAP